MSYNYDQRAIANLANLPYWEIGARLDKAIDTGSGTLLEGLNTSNLVGSPAQDAFKHTQENQKKSNIKNLLLTLGTVAAAISGFLLLKKKLPNAETLKSWKQIGQEGVQNVTKALTETVKKLRLTGSKQQLLLTGPGEQLLLAHKPPTIDAFGRIINNNIL